MRIPRCHKLGILGGSFDPPHDGHLEMTRWVLANNMVDQVMVIPCADHPFSKTLSAFPDRLKLCHQFFEGIQNLHISPLESTLPTPNYTAFTLETIHKARPDLELYFLIGSDQLPTLSSWRNLDHILELCTFIVFPRVDHPVDSELLPADCLFQNEACIPGYQSTHIRKSIKKGEPKLSQYNSDLQEQLKDLYED